MAIKKLSDKEIKQLTEAHLDEGITECRWCFAVDLVRIEGDEISKHLYDDALFIHLRCSRCDGKFTLYSPGWGEDYLKERVSQLHPEFENIIDDRILNEINDRVIYHGDC